MEASVRMRIAIHAPKVSDPGAVGFAEKASDSFWLPRKTAPARQATYEAQDLDFGDGG